MLKIKNSAELKKINLRPEYHGETKQRACDLRFVAPDVDGKHLDAMIPHYKALLYKDGLPLPLTFTGEPASEFLIDQAEQDAREAGMKRICGGCHGSDWVNGHFAKMDGTIEEVDKMTLASTLMMVETWKRGVESDKNPFDETIEKMWVQQWLFYANSIKYASAMTGAPDYASFKLGWWEMSRNLQGMKDTLETKGAAMKRE